jgi:hypothetical protein
VWVRCAAWLLVLAMVLDELWLEEVDPVGVDELADDVAAAGPASVDELVLEDVLCVVEWLPDPHAATSSAVASAAVAGLTIASA